MITLKQGLVGAALVSTLGAGVTGATVFAAEKTSGGSIDDLITTLASKFDLNADDVREVFTEHHEAMEEERAQEREAELEAKLAQAVTDGKLTQDQADALKAQHEEHEQDRESDRESFASMTEEERQAAMEERRESMDAFLESEGISKETLREIFGDMRRGGGRGEMSGEHRMMPGDMGQPQEFAPESDVAQAE